MSHLHISYFRADAKRKVRRKCPTCQKRTTFVAFFQHWYGWYMTCLGCGESWQDGEMLERPFRPRWRADSIAQARRMWKETEAPHTPHPFQVLTREWFGA